jgi:hypothetical protein
VTGVLKSNIKHLTDQIVQAVVRQAVVSLSIQITLMCIPVIGWAIAAVMSVLQQITGKIYEAQMKREINNCIGDIQQRGEVVKSRVEAVAIRAANEELPAAQALAVSNDQLNGLGDFWSKLVSPVNKIIKQVPRIIPNAGRSIRITVQDPKKLTNFVSTLNIVGLARVAVKAAGKVVVFAADRIEDTKLIQEGILSKPITSVMAEVDDVGKSAQRMASPFTVVQESTGLVAKHGSQVVAAGFIATGNEKAAEEVLKVGRALKKGTDSLMPALMPVTFYNLVTGRESVMAAKDACERMRSQAYAALDKTGTDAIAALNAPEGRAKLRIAMAKGMRQDPAFAAGMQELRDLQSQQLAPLAAQHAALEQQVGKIATPVVTPIPANVVNAGTNTNAIIGTAAAAVGAFLFFH